jgi:hypothetical protein
MNIYDSHNWLFVSFEQGAGGHRIARELAEADDVYWYDHPDNNLSKTDIRQRTYGSEYHFNRYTDKGHLPPPYDYVRDYIEDEKYYYNEIFEPKFIEAGGAEILKEYKLPYCTHMLPGEIKKRFPNAEVINVIRDPLETAQRYMDVASEFPGFVKHKDFISEDNHRVQFLQSIHNIKPNFTTKDVWAMEKFGTLFNQSMYNELFNQKLNEFKFKFDIRNKYSL